MEMLVNSNVVRGLEEECVVRAHGSCAAALAPQDLVILCGIGPDIRPCHFPHRPFVQGPPPEKEEGKAAPRRYRQL